MTLNISHFSSPPGGKCSRRNRSENSLFLRQRVWTAPSCGFRSWPPMDHEEVLLAWAIHSVRGSVGLGQAEQREGSSALSSPFPLGLLSLLILFLLYPLGFFQRVILSLKPEFFTVLPDLSPAFVQLHYWVHVMPSVGTDCPVTRKALNIRCIYKREVFLSLTDVT